MHFAFLLMGSEKRTQLDENNAVIGVSSIEEAEEISRELVKEGVMAIELCGAFGEEGARRIIKATEHKIAVGYVTHFPEDDDLFIKAFGS